MMAGAHRFLNLFRRDQSGATAMLFGIGLLALVLMTGFGIDYYRWTVARSETQAVLDGAALSAAASRARDEPSLRAVADAHVAANATNMLKAYVDAAFEHDLTYVEDRVTVGIRGGVPTIFMGLVGVQTMPLNVEAVATRGQAEAVELVLVLDNTGSMNQVDAGGQSRINALKAAANDLVNKVKEREDADVKVGVVPYAEYVNVGTAYRGQPWLSINEYDVFNPAKPGQGTYPDNLTVTVCLERDPDYWVDETRQLDGRTQIVRVKKTGACRRSETRPDPKAGQPRPGTAASTTRFRWHGCVYSRLGALRLTDAEPMTPYVGMVVSNGRRDCMTPILPLSSSKPAVNSAINGMTTVISGRSTEPYTHIPSGLIWGVNVLSPGAPFTEGRAYAEDNRNPRKIMVLMTDGQNTMRYKTSGASHGVHEHTTAAGQLRQTNDDVTAICSYAKSRNIEIYTVALGIEDSASTTMLRGCASEPDFFFNASDNAALRDAFDAIAASINRVRLVR